MKILRLSWIMMLAVAIPVALAACGGETTSTPSQLDAPYLNATQSPVARASDTPWPTAWPTATRYPTAPPNQAPTAYPTVDRLEGTAPSIEDAIPPGDWLYAPFTDDQGQSHTLSDYLGRGVILHTLSASCTECILQQRMLSQAILDRQTINALPDTVFVSLSVVNTDTGASSKRRSSANWARTGPAWTCYWAISASAQAVFGVASQTLLDALAEAFGPEVNDPEYLTVIAIERDGYAHMLMTGLVDWHVLRDAISAYGTVPESAQ